MPCPSRLQNMTDHLANTLTVCHAQEIPGRVGRGQAVHLWNLCMTEELLISPYSGPPCMALAAILSPFPDLGLDLGHLGTYSL